MLQGRYGGEFDVVALDEGWILVLRFAKPETRSKCQRIVLLNPPELREAKVNPNL